MVNLKESIISEIKDLAIKCGVEKVILFGSRARGDNKERSDIDLAIVGGNAALFTVEAEEEIQTLLMFDIVDLGGFVQEELRQSIEREGKIIYEKI